MKLSKTKIKQIEAWLRNKKKDKVCPFKASYCDNRSLQAKICTKVFPKTRDYTEQAIGFASRCPCKTYTLGYVVKKAKKMVETGEI